MDKKKRGILLTVLALLSLVVITTGVTLAFFNYAKEGSTENSVTTGTITFLYTEVSGVGRGISISDAYPISDTVGKVQVGEGNVFDFKVTSQTPNKTSIPYEVTARKKSDSTLDEDAVKLYLTKVAGDSEEEVLLSKYSELVQTSKVEASKYTEKTIYTGKVPSNSTNYEQAFRLRMWIDENTNFSPNSDGTYPYNGKTFTVTVNVYANAKVITDEEIALESNANISSLSVGDEVLTKVEGQVYDYAIALPEGTTSTAIKVETENPNATVSVEKIDSLVYTSNIKRLSTSKTLNLTSGDNYFKVTVTSENKQTTKEYKVNVRVAEKLNERIMSDNTLVTANPTLTTSSNNTSDASGLYKSIATNDGSPTYYFRGNVTNNYVSFAGQTWRIVRINEDETIRIIMENGINNNATYAFNSSYNNYSYMYYSNSNAKTQLNNWYNANIASNTNYESKVVTGDYFCEQAKAKFDSNWTSGNANMTTYTSYTPNFKCTTDGNGKGLVNTNIGLITYDEVVFAGGYYYSNNNSYYLYNNALYWNWTMSPAGFTGFYAMTWNIHSVGAILYNYVSDTRSLRPILILKADTIVTGSGTSIDPYVVQ